MEAVKASAVAVLYSDEDIIVVNKPPGVLSIPDRFRRGLPTVRGILERRFGRIYVVHRLDKDTSGVMLFARTAEAHRALCRQFEYQRVEKHYHAVVAGVLEKDELVVDFPLLPDPRRPGRVIPSARGKEARTHIRVLQRFQIATFVECRLTTGRLHQVRVHCAAIGHPLLVDPDYGGAAAFFLSSIKRRYKLAAGEEELPLLRRVPLHACVLGFEHPRTGTPMRLDAPLPKDLRALLHTLQKYAPYSPAWLQPI
ncbi:MAG: RluA family pseudouridine synthase [Candidatus Kapabacteria bacterium]|nr:RluA family pseudouridine synthase [Candidatus Kapabacteria bacterium]